ncbi:MAG: YIEGIA family protein [Bacillota bacterium]|jgi:hypothetical protein
MENYLNIIIAGTLVGTLARVLLLRQDYRQYPGYPHGYVSHFALGFIASALGAVAVPAILEPDFTAFTFLALAAQQFREIRGMERQTLENLDKTELVIRGSDYIEGIARTFEARNFLAMGAAFIASISYAMGGPIAAGIMGMMTIFLSRSFMTGDTIGDICEVVPAKLHFKNTLLMVEEIDMMTVGLKEMRSKILENGLGVVLHPKDDNARAILHDMGQRLAIAHTATLILGTKKDIDIPEFTPLVRKYPDTGKVALYIMPLEKDMDALLYAVKRTPVLESSRSKPLRTKAGRMASD